VRRSRVKLLRFQLSKQVIHGRGVKTSIREKVLRRKEETSL
jgi:hypothetical protein